MFKIIFMVKMFVTSKYLKKHKCSSTGDWLDKFWNVHTM